LTESIDDLISSIPFEASSNSFEASLSLFSPSPVKSLKSCSALSKNCCDSLQTP